MHIQPRGWSLPYPAEISRKSDSEPCKSASFVSVIPYGEENEVFVVKQRSSRVVT